ncbi:DMT family transporter [Sciscionella marina]|uniref:DMT family transporter n=1 Tax=Sciscionella marina TaxID=508770 RepID=UPI0012F6A241|nr:DMT family transporter [Sciscionella marina]
MGWQQKETKSVLGIALMVLAAMLNAIASVLQRKAARAEPERKAFSLTMFSDLLRRPVWLLGIGVMLAGFITHAISISVSEIALVQPLLVAELPLTLLLASWVFGLRMRARDWVAIGLASIGLAALLACLSPHGGNPRSAPISWWLLGACGCAAGIALLVLIGYRGRHEHRAALLGVATGAAFGLNSSLIAGVGAAVAAGTNLFAAGQTYGIIVLGPVSFFLLQNALQAGNLVASQPGFTLTNPAVSVVFGLAVFGEQGRTGWWLLGSVGGAVMIGAATVLLSRSPLLDPDARHDTGHDLGNTAGSRGSS